MEDSVMAPLAPASSPWATLRFRRSKDVKGWAILGVPQSLYPLVMQPLFERQARFIDKYERGEFVNVLFEAPVTLAAQLALAFPAPPGCEPLVVNGGGDRILYGRAADSARARRQRPEGEPRPGLERLGQAEGFWSVVTALAGAGLDAEPSPVPGTPPRTGRNRDLLAGSKQGLESLGLVRAVDLVRPGEREGAAGSAIAQPQTSAVSLPVGLDDEGFELDAWPQELQEPQEPQAAGDGLGPDAVCVDTEAFEDVWDMEEADDFWAAEPGARSPEMAPSQPPVAPSAPVVPTAPTTPLAPATPVAPTAPVAPAVTPAMEGLANPGSANPGSANQDSGTYTPGPAATTPPQGALVSASTAQLRSGLLPQASDAQVLQNYASGGLTIAQAIAQMQQQEAQPQQPQRRRIELPFETAGAPPRQSPRLPPGPPGPSPQLPSESWRTGGASAGDWRERGEPNGPVAYPERPLPETAPSAVSWPRLPNEFPPNELPPVDLTQQLSPAPTDIVCLPVAEVQHLEMLRWGVARWNAWRREYPEIRPNLRGAYLNNLDLYGADLHGVDLRDAFLFRADLRGADLSLAALGGADLIRADLGGACLWGACLGGAYLNYANLAQADLTQANVRGAFWQGAILQGAIMPNGQDFAAWAAD